jgi:hypothetical protein
MADLDDFFAKKDKKKKGTKKFSKANTDVIAKNLEESAKKEQKAQEKLEPLATSAALNNEETKVETKAEEDEEWDDYRENKKDYTGLKIETLKVESDQEENDTEETELNEDGEVVAIKKGDSGPWNKKAGSNSTSSEPSSQEEKPGEPDPPAPPAASTGGSSYVPPHMRGSAAASNSEPTGRRPVPRRMRAAPDISSEVYFPSLSSTVDDSAPKGAWGKKLAKQDEGQFEEVRERQGQMHSSRSAETPKLTLGNKFDALRDED